jgi:hypothetical protein
MNRLMCGVFAVIALTACAPTAPPTPASAPQQSTVPALKPPVDSLAFYVGNWQCKGTYFATADEPEKKWEATMKVEPELDGSWLSVQMTGPGENRTIEHKGYDPTAKKWMHIVVVRNGGWGTLSSPGWTGSQMTFTPDDPADKTRGTFTKLSETSYSHAEVRITDKGEVKDWEKICTKM